MTPNNIFQISQKACLRLGFFLSVSLAFSRPITGQAANALPLITQLSIAFSGAQVVQHVQLTGNATWTAGSLKESGTVNLIASPDGSWQMQLVLATSGGRTESQTGTGMSAACQWTGTDDITHDVDPGNCWRPAVWFLPALSFQSSLLPSHLNASDLGLGAVGSGPSVYRHLQSELVFSSLPTEMAGYIANRSVSDLGLDPSSLLPVVLTFSVHPDDGSESPIAMEIHYSQYRLVEGTEIPFHIQRYVNGSLQLDVVISSAQIN